MGVKRGGNAGRPKRACAKGEMKEFQCVENVTGKKGQRRWGGKGRAKRVGFRVDAKRSSRGKRKLDQTTWRERRKLCLPPDGNCVEVRTE